MKAESNVKPQLVERYPGLVRINYDVLEEQREDMDGKKSIVYVYRMLELPSVNMSVDELTATLIADKYDKATQIQMASDDDKKITLALFSANCTIYAKTILGMEPSLADVKAQKLAEISVYDAFFVPKGEIVGNEYDLSINKYKKTEYKPVEYASTAEIMAEIRELEMEIGKGLEELEEML